MSDFEFLEKSFEPKDRMGRIANTALDVMKLHEESLEGDKIIVMMYAEDGHASTAMSGYDDPIEAMTDLMIHMKAVMEASGKRMQIGFIGPDGLEVVG